MQYSDIPQQNIKQDIKQVCQMISPPSVLI